MCCRCASSISPEEIPDFAARSMYAWQIVSTKLFCTTLVTSPHFTVSVMIVVDFTYAYERE